MDTSTVSPNIRPAIKGSAPVWIKNTWIGILILVGCIAPPILGYLLGSGPDHIMPYKQAIFFTIPWSICLILLPFTGILRKILFAIPLPIILLITFWPLIIPWLIEKINRPQDDLRNNKFYSFVLWIVDVGVSVVLGWISLGIGAVILITTITTLSK